VHVCLYTIYILVFFITLHVSALRLMYVINDVSQSAYVELVDEYVGMTVQKMCDVKHKSLELTPVSVVGLNLSQLYAYMWCV
jgi:hypothetical protein